MQKRRCPTCQTYFLATLFLEELGLELDQCPHCKGIWFDKGELEHFLDTTAAKVSVPAEAEPSLRICCLCHKKMLVFHYPKTMVSVDYCRDCRGLWLDAGELNQIRPRRYTLNLSEGTATG